MKYIYKKSLAWFLTIAMLISMLPATGFAAEDSNVTNTLTPQASENKDVSLSKTAVRTGADTWEITLKVSPKESALKPIQYEVMLLLDDSKSMGEGNNLNDMKDVLKGDDGNQGLIDTLANAGAKVGVVRFSGSKGNLFEATAFNNGEFYDLSNSENADKLKTDLDTNLKTSGGTYLDPGLEIANDMFTSSSSDSDHRASIIIINGRF